MDDKVIRLRHDFHNADLVERDRPPPNQELIDRLRQLLAEAESGELRNLVGVGMCLTHDTREAVYAGDVMFKYLPLIGALQLQLRFLCDDAWAQENGRDN